MRRLSLLLAVLTMAAGCGGGSGESELDPSESAVAETPQAIELTARMIGDCLVHDGFNARVGWYSGISNIESDSGDLQKIQGKSIPIRDRGETIATLAVLPKEDLETVRSLSDKLYGSDGSTEVIGGKVLVYAIATTMKPQRQPPVSDIPRIAEIRACVDEAIGNA